MASKATGGGQPPGTPAVLGPQATGPHHPGPSEHGPQWLPAGHSWLFPTALGLWVQQVDPRVVWARVGLPLATIYRKARNPGTVPLTLESRRLSRLCVWFWEVGDRQAQAAVSRVATTACTQLVSMPAPG